jgi:hypothetical protein
MQTCILMANTRGMTQMSWVEFKQLTENEARYMIFSIIKLFIQYN